MTRSVLCFHYDPIDDKSSGSDSGALGVRETIVFQDETGFTIHGLPERLIDFVT